MEAKLKYITAGCTSARNMAAYYQKERDSAKDGMDQRVVYAAGRNIIDSSLINEASSQVRFGTHHDITCLKIFPDSEGKGILAGCSDGSLYIHNEMNETNNVQVFELKSPIVALDCWVDKKGKGNYFVAVVATLDSTLHVIAYKEGSTTIHKNVSTLTDRITCLSVLSVEMENHFVILVASSNNAFIAFHLSLSPQSPNKEDLIIWKCLNNVVIEGHTNWVSTMCHSTVWVPKENGSSSSLLLATGSHDRTVRLWRLSMSSDQIMSKGQTDTQVFELIPLRNFDTILIDNQRFTLRIDLETVLLGHEDLVHSVQVVPSPTSNYSDHQDEWTLSVITAGADGFIFKWQCVDKETRLWQSVKQVSLPMLSGGPLGSDLFDGHLFVITANKGNGTREILTAHNAMGSFLTWDLESGLLLPLIVSGHVNQVNDLSYDPIYGVIYSASADKTVRVWNPTTGRELSRPIIHGHEIRGVAPITSPNANESGRPQIVVVSDEKVVRIMEDQNLIISSSLTAEPSPRTIPLVSAPPLGLSNRIVDDKNVSYDPNHLTENDLIHHTLWPETDKLYGHEDELYTVASSSPSDRHSLFATAAKCSLAGDTHIRLWTMNPIPKLLGKLPLTHQLTVVNLAFNPSVTRLLSVSRDRTAAIYDLQSDDNIKLWMIVKGFHQRIIWSACWLDDDNFCTVGRDGLVAIWSCPSLEEYKVDENMKAIISTPIYMYRHSESVTAVAYFNEILIIGTESGQLLVSNRELTQMNIIPKLLCPCATISKLIFLKSIEGKGSWLLAVASEDNSIRVLEFVVG